MGGRAAEMWMVRTQLSRRREAAVLSHRTTLAVFYSLGGLLLLLVGLTRVWMGVDHLVMTLLGAFTFLVSALLWCVPRLPSGPMHVLVAGGSVIIATAVWAGGGAAPSAAVAMFTVWVLIYSALFLSPRQAAVHDVFAMASTCTALTLCEPWESAVLHATLLVAITVSSAAIVGFLTRRTRILASTDALTGLLNETGLSEVVTRDLLVADEQNPGMLVLLDLDRFGELNEALGRESGDDLLRQVAAAHQRGVGESGVLARLGGDDFAVWMTKVPPALQGPVPGQVNLERLMAGIGARSGGPFEVAGISVDVDITVGVVLASSTEVGLKTLLQRADTALHAARHADRPAQVWSPQLQEHNAESVQLQAELRAAVTDGQLRVYYQPLVEAHSLRMRGVEALVRWQHPTRGLLAPGTFIPAAERTSVIVALTDWVLGEALDQAGRWRGGRALQVSVNISARLIADEGLTEQVREHLRRSGVPAHLLVLEVTESAVTTQPRRAAATLAELRALGVRIALDDFGTGYTSLAMLQDLPIDELKVDQRFVAGALAGGGDEAIVRSVVELAHRMGMEVVAEGVEDEATRQLLAELDYDLLQGYYFSRPVPAAEIEDLDFTPAPRLTLALTQPQELRRADSAERHAGAVDADDPVLRELTAIAARITEAPFALVSLIGHDKLQVRAPIGVPAVSLPREQGFCNHVLAGRDGQITEVPDASTDERFRDLIMVTDDPRIRFYAGAPVSDSDGNVLGTVCVMDQRSRSLSSAQREMLRALARAAGSRISDLADNRRHETRPVLHH